MKNSSVAIVITGHPRMVPYGYNAIRNDISVLGVDCKIFSYMWNESSDNKIITPHPNLATTEDILHDVGSITVDQPSVMREIYDEIRYQVHLPTYGWFTRQTGQIVGFLKALEYWSEELKTYDYIIRSRWDVCIDPNSVKEMLKVGRPEVIYTKFVDLNRGMGSLFGDVMLGHSSAWFESCHPYEEVIRRYVKYLKQYWTDISERWMRDHPDDKNGDWYNYHINWGLIFRETNTIISGIGDSFRITEEALDLDPTQFRAFMLK